MDVTTEMVCMQNKIKKKKVWMWCVLHSEFISGHLYSIDVRTFEIDTSVNQTLFRQNDPKNESINGQDADESDSQSANITVNCAFERP